MLLIGILALHFSTFTICNALDKSQTVLHSDAQGTIHDRSQKQHRLRHRVKYQDELQSTDKNDVYGSNSIDKYHTEPFDTDEMSLLSGESRGMSKADREPRASHMPNKISIDHGFDILGENMEKVRNGTRSLIFGITVGISGLLGLTTAAISAMHFKSQSRRLDKEIKRLTPIRDQLGVTSDNLSKEFGYCPTHTTVEDALDFMVKIKNQYSIDSLESFTKNIMTVTRDSSNTVPLNILGYIYVDDPLKTESLVNQEVEYLMDDMQAMENINGIHCDPRITADAQFILGIEIKWLGQHEKRIQDIVKPMITKACFEKDEEIALTSIQAQKEIAWLVEKIITARLFIPLFRLCAVKVLSDNTGYQAMLLAHMESGWPTKSVDDMIAEYRQGAIKGDWSEFRDKARQATIDEIIKSAIAECSTEYKFDSELQAKFFIRNSDGGQIGDQTATG